MRKLRTAEGKKEAADKAIAAKEKKKADRKRKVDEALQAEELKKTEELAKLRAEDGVEAAARAAAVAAGGGHPFDAFDDDEQLEALQQAKKELGKKTGVAPDAHDLARLKCVVDRVDDSRCDSDSTPSMQHFGLSRVDDRGEHS
jgi:hypothetical protein